MKVFKFGGASVKDAEAVKNVATILAGFRDEQILIVLSAMGKTTNALEQLASAYYNRESNIQQIFEGIRSFHNEVVKGLLKNTDSHAYDDIENLFIELDCLLETQPEGSFDSVYDQIVSYGEIFSSRIVSTYLNEAGVKNRWMDARNFINTDDTHREAKVNWQHTSLVIEKKLKPIVQKQMVITQGFIGYTKDKMTTTLGREGSDYSAAIFAYCLHAESVTIWKDVDGVMNADPKKFPGAVRLEGLSYSHAIELAYYGATVIHPKTIQPLQSRGIPLFVKSFVAPSGPGTKVGIPKSKEEHIPTFISKTNQVLLSMSSKDFSFIVEDNLSAIFAIFAEHNTRINLMQNSAISFSLCFDHKGEELEKLKSELSINYNLLSNDNVELLTVMHYDDESVGKLTAGREILLEQRTRGTIQFVLK